MAEDPLRPDHADPAAHGLTPEDTPGRDEDERLVEILKRLTPLILLVVLSAAGIFGWGAYREQRQARGERLATHSLGEALKEWSDPARAREILQQQLAQGIYEEQALKPWAEFLVVRTQVIEAQTAYAAGGPAPEDALAAVEDFLTTYPRHSELTPLASLAKAALLDDLGRYSEAQAAMTQVTLAHPDATASIVMPVLQQGKEERQRLWEQLRQRLNP